MIKGVQKNIIEVSETNNEYFEKAILFLKDPRLPQDPEKARTHARSYLEHLAKAVASRPSHPVLMTGKLTAAAALGAVITALILR